MITTNKTQPVLPQGEPTKLSVVTTNKLTPREFSFTPREYPGVDKRQTQKVGGMLTTIDLEERKRLTKRAAISAEIKSQKKKAGRPKKAR